MGLPLVTRAEYKAYQGISSTTSDTTIDSLIVKVSELVKSVCRRSFVDYIDEAKVEYSEGGSDTIELSETPVLSISSVEYSADYGANYSTLTEYVNFVLSKTQNNLRPILVASPPPELLGYVPYGSRSNPIFPEAINGYRITYTAGYETLPEDLKLAVLDLIARAPLRTALSCVHCPGLLYAGGAWDCRPVAAGAAGRRHAAGGCDRFQFVRHRGPGRSSPQVGLPRCGRLRGGALPQRRADHVPGAVYSLRVRLLLCSRASGAGWAVDQ